MFQTFQIQHIINDIVNGDHEKVASHNSPYSTDAVLGSLEKVASSSADRKIGDLLKIAANTIKQLVNQNGDLEKQASVRVILEDMGLKGMLDEGEFEQKTAELLGKTPDELHIFSEAIKLASGMNSGSSHYFENSKEPSLSKSREKNMFDNVLNI